MERFLKALQKLDEQSFRPGDSVVASTINHPIDAIGKFGGWLANQVNTAAGIPDQYDNPYPYLAPSPEAQTQAAFDVAGMAQLGSMPFAPKSAGGTVGTLARPADPLDDNLNAELLQKYLQQGSLTPDELAQYERNAVAMRDSNRQYLNVANANAQGGTPESRAVDLGFDTDLYHGRYKDYPAVKDGRTFYATNDPDYASIYAFEPTASSMGGKSVSDFQDLQPNVLPVKVRSNDFLDTRTKQGRKVFENDFFMKYGNGTPLTEKGLPDWVDAEDFGEMFADTESKFKGVLADEGAIPTWDGGTKDRGVSHAVFDPKVIRSRFAAFDPLRKDSADLLATKLLPASMLGLGMYGENQDYEALKRALVPQ